MHLPSLVEFAGYVHFVPGSLFCPFFEPKQYLEFVEMRGAYKHLQPPDAKTPKIPPSGNIKQALLRSLQGFLCVGVFLGFVDGMGFDLQLCSERTAEEHGVLRNIGFYLMGILGERFMVYAVWC